MVQRHALDRHVAAMLLGTEFDSRVALERDQGFELEQGDLPALFGLVRIKSFLAPDHVAVALDPSAGDESKLLHRAHWQERARGEMEEADQASPAEACCAMS